MQSMWRNGRSLGCGAEEERGWARQDPDKQEYQKHVMTQALKQNFCCPFCSCGPEVLICKPAYTEFPHSANVPVTREAAGTENTVR